MEGEDITHGNKVNLVFVAHIKNLQATDRVQSVVEEEKKHEADIGTIKKLVRTFSERIKHFIDL
jgi:hypothetical protein